MKLIKATEYIPMPWKNGLGLTAQIDRFPVGDGPYLWRLSQATIEVSTTFSIFPGYDRWLMLLTNEPIFLNEDRLDPLRPFQFSGDQSIYCRLSGAKAQDIGLIYDRSRVKAQMQLIDGRTSLEKDQVHYVFDLESGDTQKFNGTNKIQIETKKSLLISIELI